MGKHQYTATVFGSTGLVGKQIVNQLEKDENYIKIYLPNRRRIKRAGKKIENQLIDFDQLDNYPQLFQVDHIFIALGTTIKKAGSKAQFQKVDLDYPKLIATYAKRYGTKTLLMISSIGANEKSSNFYLRTKGKAEMEVGEILGDLAYFVRPSMLLGKRQEFRFGEALGKVLLQSFHFLMLGPLRKYRGIKADEVAAAMIHIAKTQPQEHCFDSERLKSLIK